MQRLLRRTVTMIVMACMILVMAVPALAGETASADSTKTENAAVLADDNGVVQVLYVYTDDNGDSYLLEWGTGFFVNETNIITCNHVVSLDSELEEAVTDFFNISVKQLRERLSVQISVYRDSTPMEAEIVSNSPTMDYAILQMKQPMSNKTPLTIRHSAEVKKTEAVYTIGFPGAVEEYKVVNGGTGEDSSINGGKVVSTDNMVNNGQSIECIVSDNVVSGGNSGGPLVDNNGYVVGICQSVVDGKYAYSVAIDQVLKDLDARGIAYTLADDPAETVTEPAQTVTPAPAENPADDSSAEPEAPSYTNPSGDDGNTIDPADGNGGDGSTEDSGLPISKTMLLIIIVVVVVVVIIIILLLMMSKKKKQAAVGSIPVPGGTAPGQPNGPAGGFGGTPAGGFTPGNKAPGSTAYGGSPETEVLGNAGETTLLGQGSNETTVLNHNKNYGKLTRKKTGESVTINRDSFKIGKERSKVDYCVSDNTAVSRLHAIIIHRNGRAFIVDQNSKNFTLVNDVRATANVEVPIKNGDKITIADEEYTYNAN